MNKRESIKDDLLTKHPKLKEVLDKKKYDIAAVVNDVLNTKELKDELAQIDSDEEKQKRLQIFKEYQLLQQLTFLGETYCVDSRKTMYSVRDGHVYFDALSPTIPFDEYMAFFVVLSVKEGSSETLRHLSELYAHIQIDVWAQKEEEDDNHKETYDGEYFMISSEGKAPETRYNKRYVDWGKKTKNVDTGERYLEITRYTSVLPHEDFLQRRISCEPAFASQGLGLPIDARLFAPYFMQQGSDSYASRFGRHPDAIDEQTFLREIFNSQDVDEEGMSLSAVPVVIEYIEEVCSEAPWIQLFKSYDAILNIAKKANENFRRKKELNLLSASTDMPVIIYDASMKAGLVAIGMLTQNKTDGISSGCDPRDGFNIGFDDPLSKLIDKLSMKSLIQTFTENSPLESIKQNEICAPIKCRGIIHNLSTGKEYACGWSPKNEEEEKYEYCPDCGWAPGLQKDRYIGEEPIAQIVHPVQETDDSSLQLLFEAPPTSSKNKKTEILSEDVFESTSASEN